MTQNKIKLLAQAVSRNPNDSFSKFALALELIKSDRVDQALILFESIYRNEPSYIGIYYHLGKLYQHLDRIEEAEKCFSEGIERAKQQKETRTRSELQEALLQLKEETSDE